MLPTSARNVRLENHKLPVVPFAAVQTGSRGASKNQMLAEGLAKRGRLRHTCATVVSIQLVNAHARPAPRRLVTPRIGTECPWRSRRRDGGRRASPARARRAALRARRRGLPAERRQVRRRPDRRPRRAGRVARLPIERAAAAGGLRGGPGARSVRIARAARAGVRRGGVEPRRVLQPPRRGGVPGEVLRAGDWLGNRVSDRRARTHARVHMHACIECGMECGIRTRGACVGCGMECGMRTHGACVEYAMECGMECGMRCLKACGWCAVRRAGHVVGTHSCPDRGWDTFLP
eukprot:363435-Chlamydomonas_euryale.AAC.3